MITIKSNDLFTAIVAGVIAGTMFILADGLNQLINGNTFTIFTLIFKIISPFVILLIFTAVILLSERKK